MDTFDRSPVAGAVPSGDALADLATRLVGFDTQNPPGRTRELVDWLADWFNERDIAVEEVAVDPAKPNLLARVPGERDATLCLNGHVDTVPFDDAEWAYDPLGERVDGRVYGRGATDMKGPLAAMLAVAEAYADTGATPPVDLLFLVVSDEETGGGAGLSALLEADRVEADACVIGETTCGPDRHSVTVADRGSIWLTLSATGEAAHGSRPLLGENAIDRLYGGIETLRERFGSRPLEIPEAVAPILEESVDYYEPQFGREAARDLFEYPSINLGTIAGGEAINSVPQTATAEIDVRLTAAVPTEEVLAAIRACADDCEGVTIDDVSWSVGSYERLDSPLVTAVADLAEDVVGEHVYRRSATGGGDAKKLRRAGVPTVEFGLGTDTAHAVDEYTTVDALRGNAEVYARLPWALADAL
ncbi:M20 family metallopeptidase [Halobacteriales archaeon Cl-PHB]